MPRSNRRSIPSACLAALALCLAGPLSSAAADEPPAIPVPPSPAQQPAEPKADDHPPIFANLKLAEARDRNKSDGRILVVKATAVWCGPCKRMDKTTWREQAVVDWFKAKGTAISLDVDELPDDAKELRISAMPTMVAFKAGQEVDRAVGYKSGADLLAWLGQVERGETAASRLAVKRALPREGEGAMSMQARLEFANELTEAGLNAEATEEYVWLWDNMTRIQPSMVGVRASFMAGSMERLAATNADAKARFTRLRDAAHERTQARNKDFNDLLDWLSLNEIIGDQEATLAWFDRVKTNPKAEATIARVEHRILPLLEQHDRWADLGRLTSKPMDKLAEAARTSKMMVDMSNRQTGDPEADAEMRKSMLDYANSSLREAAGRIYASLLAAGRDVEAAKLAEQAIKVELEDPEQMAHALVTTAIRAGQAKEIHRAMLAERPLPEPKAHATPAPEQTLEERNRNEHTRAQSDRERAERRTAALEELEAALSEAKQPGDVDKR